ncbi:hypothetical protein O2N63_17475 [Aliiroseovarius sp. KMU-50]|uniref:Uncharacterized protein n=2 Tax=Aliiroseovarius salicola TaxID=3009082 RepID=A0ABT4W617_9RHOB|nr:hypothetical protein [Aliiroseovarius sp. KMU-50]MDA5095884.1 hypothetical protein [Aliiroseovarius sp. KMU-50]
MYKSVGAIGGAVFLLASCTEYQEADLRGSGGFIKELPEAVLTIAAPYQDLTAVRIDPEDGCYVYRHAGPVETTFLPLRSVRGRPICTRPANVETESSQAG